MPFDSAPVHGDTELLLNLYDQVGGRRRRRCGALPEHELKDGRREFVRSVRATLPGDQPREALLCNRMLRLVERRPRQPERRCSVGHRCFVDLDAANHLVFDLQQVVRIEEVACLEQRIGYGLRMGIEDALLTECLNLCRISRVCWHEKSGQLFCIYNYAAFQIPVKCQLVSTQYCFK
jgi:hypothetical protein